MRIQLFLQFFLQVLRSVYAKPSAKLTVDNQYEYFLDT